MGYVNFFCLSDQLVSSAYAGVLKSDRRVLERMAVVRHSFLQLDSLKKTAATLWYQFLQVDDLFAWSSYFDERGQIDLTHLTAAEIGKGLGVYVTDLSAATSLFHDERLGQYRGSEEIEARWKKGCAEKKEGEMLGIHFEFEMKLPAKWLSAEWECSQTEKEKMFWDKLVGVKLYLFDSDKVEEKSKPFLTFSKKEIEDRDLLVLSKRERLQMLINDTSGVTVHRSRTLMRNNMLNELCSLSIHNRAADVDAIEEVLKRYGDAAQQDHVSRSGHHWWGWFGGTKLIHEKSSFKQMTDEMIARLKK
jgi:hypothetical protein